MSDSIVIFTSGSETVVDGLFVSTFLSLCRDLFAFICSRFRRISSALLIPKDFLEASAFIFSRFRRISSALLIPLLLLGFVNASSARALRTFVDKDNVFLAYCVCSKPPFCCVTTAVLSVCLATELVCPVTDIDR